jgi:hypothetical protein
MIELVMKTRDEIEHEFIKSITQQFDSSNPNEAMVMLTVTETLAWVLGYKKSKE